MQRALYLLLRSFKQRMVPREAPEVVVEEIGSFDQWLDSVHFSDNDLLVDEALLRRLCNALEKSEAALDPEVCEGQDR